MPGRDGTGQMGCGSMARRGSGFCNGANPRCKGADIGLGQGFGRRRAIGKGLQIDSTGTPKELLQEQKKELESKLEIICKQLQSL